jgi:hypothetical protein
MKIKVQYESSRGSHPVNLPENALEQMINSGNLSFTEKIDNKGKTKTISITGNDREKWLLAQALLKSMDL